jgi:hypothetical protein
MIRIDPVQLAVAGVAVLTALTLLTQWRALRRMRLAVQRDLARIFEQVDLLRLDTQQMPATQAAPALAIPTIALADVPTLDAGIGYAAALELAARGADEREITSRCGLSSAEARILVAMRGMSGTGRARELH